MSQDVDVDVDGVDERRPKPLCPQDEYILQTLQPHHGLFKFGRLLEVVDQKKTRIVKLQLYWFLVAAAGQHDIDLPADGRG